MSAELWELGSAGIQEVQNDTSVTLIAAFEDPSRASDLLLRFASLSPIWSAASGTDWVAATHAAWPARVIGSKLFLALPWSEEPTPAGRQRIIHNPGSASGTGEHPCTQLALEALERCIGPGARLIDIGTGSGILAMAGLQLGASTAVAVDIDEPSIETARGNFRRNDLPANLVVGSADCLAAECAEIVVANLNATVLLALADDLLRIARPGGSIILTGFPEVESAAVQEVFPPAEVLTSEGWSCLISPSI